MKDYKYRCPFCQSELGSCKKYVKCKNCKAKVKIIYPKLNCKKCTNDKFISYIQGNFKMTYCGNCGKSIEETSLVSENTLTERLEFKIKIPKDYIIDLQLDMYEFEIGRKILKKGE